jgi:hypothetical protein
VSVIQRTSVWLPFVWEESFRMFHLKDHLPEPEPILGDGTLDGMYTSVDPRIPDHNYHLPWIESRHRGYEVFQFGGHVHGGRVSFRLVCEDVVPGREVRAGLWEGEIRTVGGGIPVELTLKDDGLARLRVADGTPSDDREAGSEVRVSDGIL